MHVKEHIKIIYSTLTMLQEGFFSLIKLLLIHGILRGVQTSEPTTPI